MNATTQRLTAEQYLQRVRAALGDLPADEREELLEDLPAHLADVAAETDGELEQRLGTPEEYAAELRLSAGIEAAAPAPAGRTGFAADARRRLTVLAGSLDQYPLWRQFRGFLPQLRPGWWVLRGYLAALALAVVFTDLDRIGLVPHGGDVLLFLPFALVACWVSVLLGQRTRPHPAWRRWAVRALNVAVLIAAVAMANTQPWGYYGSGVSYYERAAPDAGAGAVTDVYVYDSAGRPLHDVRLFDQYGNPLVLPGGPSYYSRESADGSGPVENVYPRGPYGSVQPDGIPPRMQPPPSVPPLLPPSGSPTATPSTSPSDNPTPTATPAR